MKRKTVTRLLSLGLSVALTLACLSGCGNAAQTAAPAGDDAAPAAAADAGDTADADAGETEVAAGDIVDFTFFGGMPGVEINSGNNEIQDIIAQKTGVRLKETWLTGQTVAEAIGSIIASGTYPDLIDGGDGCVDLYNEGVLVAWDEYLESGKYPNLTNY